MNKTTAKPSETQTPASKESILVASPTLSLPKGGGAVRGIGEKFSANPVTGTSSLMVPIPTSAGRSGFGPHLNLTYELRFRQQPVWFWLEPFATIDHSKN